MTTLPSAHYVPWQCPSDGEPEHTPGAPTEKKAEESCTCYDQCFPLILASVNNHMKKGKFLMKILLFFNFSQLAIL